MIEKIKQCQKSKIFNNLLYVIEFIISILAVLATLKLVTTKMYEGYWSKKTTITSILFIIMTILIIIYNVFTHRKKIERIWLTLIIPIGIAFALLMLPLHVPDEGSHFIKAYDIAKGNFFTQVDENGQAYSIINKYLENYSYLRFDSYKTVLNEIQQKTDYQDNIEIVSAAQGYSPFLYMGTAIAIKICELFNQNIIIAIYMGRLLNYSFFLILGYFIIKKLPFGKLVMSIYLCMPMVLQQAASCSADSILNTVVIYYMVHILSILFRKQAKIPRRDKVILFILTAVVAMFKYVYLILAGLSFILLWDKRIKKKERIITVASVILIGSIFALGWLIYTSSYQSENSIMLEYKKEMNMNSSEQLQAIIKDPLHFARTLFADYKTNGENYIDMLVGSHLGWLNINPNHLIITAFIILLLFSTIAEDNEFEFKTIQKIWNIIMVFGITILIQTVMYIDWTPVKATMIGGVQGRYFIPTAILALLCLSRKHNYVKIKYPEILLPIYAIILDGCVLSTIVNFFI